MLKINWEFSNNLEVVDVLLKYFVTCLGASIMFDNVMPKSVFWMASLFSHDVEERYYAHKNTKLLYCALHDKNITQKALNAITRNNHKQTRFGAELFQLFHKDGIHKCLVAFLQKRSGALCHVVAEETCCRPSNSRNVYFSSGTVFAQASGGTERILYAC